MNTRPPHEQRVIVEANELRTKINALAAFIDSERFDALEFQQKLLLREQLDAMTAYDHILMKRITLFAPVPEPEPLPNSSNVIPMHVNVVQPNANIESMDHFAMLVDHWHDQCFEYAKRVLEIPEGTPATYIDDRTPDIEIIVPLEGQAHYAFQIGALAVMNIFKDLPFGASVEEEAPANGPV